MRLQHGGDRLLSSPLPPIFPSSLTSGIFPSPHLILTMITAIGSVFIGVSPPVTAAEQANAKSDHRGHPHYAQIRPPSSPHLGEGRPEQELASPSVSESGLELDSEPMCRDLTSFYRERVSRSTRIFIESNEDYRALQAQVNRANYLERQIRRLEQRLRRVSQSDAQRIRADIRLLQRELDGLGDLRNLRRRLRQLEATEGDDFNRVQDQRLSGLNEEAIAAFNAGNLAEAEQILEAIKKHAMDLDLFDDRIAAESNLALLEEMQGNYVEALDQYRRILQEEEENPDGSPRQQVTTLINIARLYAKLGSYDRAIANYDRALTISQQQGYPHATNIALSSKGFLENRRGNYRSALTLLERALAEVNANTLDPKAKVLHQAEIIHSGIGFAYLKLGQAQAALTAYTQALEHSRTCENKRGEAIALNGLGDIEALQGNREMALDHYQDSLNRQRALGNLASVAENYVDIAALFEEEKPEVAIALYKQAVEILEDLRTNIEPLPPEQQQEYTESVTDVYDRLADLLLDQKRILEAQQILDLLKFQELNDYLKDVREQRELDFWDHEKTILKQFHEAIALENPWTRIRQDLVIDGASEQLRQDALSQKINPSLLEGLQGDIRRMDMNGAMLYTLIRPDHLKLILIPPHGDLVHESVPVSETDLLAAIKAFQRSLKTKGSSPDSHAHQLYQWVIAPLKSTLDEHNIQTIIYAPDGQLRYVPLAAFDDGEQWLIQRYRINQITAASVTDFNTSSIEPSNPSVLAAALSPDGNYEVKIDGLDPISFGGLVNAQPEVKVIASLIENTTTLLGQDFSTASVENNLAGHHIVHFATHGKFVDGQPEESFILFEQGRANLRQIGDWPLSAANLVVFSACETAVGDELGTGAEILGLGYQVQRAGARAAIASLWKVGDDSTSFIMQRFYALRQNPEMPLSQAEALRQAQLNFVQAYSNDRYADKAHPYYWAPFILIGNGF